jgi:hypothetical protein
MLWAAKGNLNLINLVTSVFTGVPNKIGDY